MTSRPRQATSYRARIAGTALLTTCALTVTATTGCGLAMRKTTQKAAQVVAEAVLGESVSRFFDSVGQDRRGMRSQDGGSTSGDTPGLYAAVPDVPACDRGRLAGLLAQDPGKAAEWARVEGITPAEIPAFLGRTTPVLLASDTLVRNHRFENGTAVGYPALLQAGTAVLVDPWGRPVAKCGCGNPLTRLAPVPDRFEAPGMTAEWRAVYRRSSVVSVTAAGAPQTRFRLDDATAPGREIVRPTGTGGESDTTGTEPPPAAGPDKTPDKTPTTTPSKSPSKTPTSGPTPTRPAPSVTATPTPTPTRTPSSTSPRPGPTEPTRGTGGTPARPSETLPGGTGGPTRTGTAPVLTLSASSVRFGDIYVAHASGFQPGEHVRFTWSGPTAGDFGFVDADASGAVKATFREGEDPGSYQIRATGLSSGRTATAPLRVV